MGIRFDLESIGHSFAALGITALFYLGEWVDKLVYDNTWHDLLDWRAWRDCFNDVLWLRHSIMVGLYA